MNYYKKTKGIKITNFITSNRTASTLLIIIVFCVVFAIIYPNNFGTFENFSMILLNMSSEAFIVIGMVLILICAEIDLSLGSIMTLGSILCGRLMILNDMSMGIAILISLVVSIGCGLLNGLIITKMKVVSFIATLATGMIYMGIAIMLAGTGWTNFPDPLFNVLGRKVILGLQLPVFYMVIVFVIIALLLAKTRYFRQIYYIGGNVNAAELSGIMVTKVKILMYILSAILACMGGIISAMRFNSTFTNIGAGVEMRAVTAAVIGGVSFTGGNGTMMGAAMGAFFLACLNNALTITGINQNLQFLFTGIILILALVINILFSKKNRRRVADNEKTDIGS